MFTPEQSLKDVANEVATQREWYAALRHRYEEVKAEFELVNGNLIADLEAAKTNLGEAEDKARKVAIDIFLETGEKKLPFGFGIRESVTLEYDAYSALVWAVDHKIALSLDTKIFEKLAKALDLSFVREVTKASATLPTDIKKLRE